MNPETRWPTSRHRCARPCESDPTGGRRAIRPSSRSARVLQRSLYHPAWGAPSASSFIADMELAVIGEGRMARLSGKTAIVTGGAKGIGRHYSIALAAEGARIMIADIADGKELAEEIAGRHGANSVASITFDVSDETAVKGLVAQTLDRFGQIDVLVNNAAVYSTCLLYTSDAADEE